jgi:hypothetical protein
MEKQLDLTHEFLTDIAYDDFRERILIIDQNYDFIQYMDLKLQS